MHILEAVRSPWADAKSKMRRVVVTEEFLILHKRELPRKKEIQEAYLYSKGKRGKLMENFQEKSGVKVPGGEAPLGHRNQARFKEGGVDFAPLTRTAKPQS